jgi:micrococcal nuclease
MQNQPAGYEKPKSFDWMSLAKIFLILVFIPFVAIWYIWKKTTWKNLHKWIATAGVVLLVALAFAINLVEQTNQKNTQEIKALEQQVSNLQKSIGQENKITAPNAEKISPEGSVAKSTPSQKQLFEIVGVTDGDTVKVNVDGKIEAVRLIGIDTPETLDPRKPVQCFGKEASDKAKEILNNKKVVLEKDDTQGDRDQYGRLLRYVFLEDGTSFNKKMIEDGYAHEYTFQSKPYKYQTEFKTAEKNARESKRGLWASETCNGDTSKAATPVTSEVGSSTSPTNVTSVETQKSTTGVVKKSSTGICHAPGTTYYEKTKTFTSFDSVEACLASGGRLPKR